MRRDMAIGLVALGLVASFWGGTLTGEGSPEPAGFPCVEDEVWTYWPGFSGPTCIHWELVEARVRELDRGR